jgi:two-component system, OmpR family, phosphate regulon sensor histidine kinase PhoR
MIFGTRIWSFVAALLITIITLLFLSFVPNTTLLTYLVVGVACFCTSFCLLYLINEILVITEINKIFDKLKDFDKNYTAISQNKIVRNNNPIKKLDKEIQKYIQDRETEINGLKELENFRKEFIANVSHELKTPIFAAQGYVNTLIDGAMNKPEVAMIFLQKAAKSIDSLEYLVSDILVMSKAESGKLQLSFDKTDLKQIVLEVIENLKDIAQTRNVKVHFREKDLQSYLVVADYDSMYQVIKNLIENGIKYNKPEGKVLVKLKSTEKQIELSVEDNGPGIPEDDKDRIFERFFRVEKSRSRATGGTGLGLAIVKHMLLLHGSHIKLKSTLGKGSRFSFSLEKVLE